MWEDHKGNPLGDVDRHIVQNAGTGYLVLAEKLVRPKERNGPRK